VTVEFAHANHLLTSVLLPLLNYQVLALQSSDSPLPILQFEIPGPQPCKHTLWIIPRLYIQQFLSIFLPVPGENILTIICIIRIDKRMIKTHFLSSCFRSENQSVKSSFHCIIILCVAPLRCYAENYSRMRCQYRISNIGIESGTYV